ncbi:MAG TPA: MFS transporter [Spirochaetota bacterium]|nr:MFS transporter [Spirochaetota bacterium]HPI91100.1 MFS transporter [Spirochaetota bacterium]HPR49635.1 MFS transporter [Spirochaetota bacterium]
MNAKEIILYPYRWVVLAVFFLITVVIEIQWLAFAPVAREAREFYGVSAFQVDLLSILFMAVFLVMCVPASYVIDKKGIRIGIGLGAAMTGVFSVLKGVFAHDFTMILACQFFLALAQPFILNATTKVAVRWFPVNERATAVGIATLAQFVAIILVMMATPFLIKGAAPGEYNFSNMLIIYGAAAAVVSVLVLLLLKENPPTPPDIITHEESFHFFEEMRKLLKKPDTIKVLGLFFIGLGIFNALSTCIDQLCEQKGLTVEQTGMVGGIMFIAGIVGALTLPTLSDKQGKRKPYIILAMALMIPGVAGLAYATDYTTVLISSAIMGFFLLGAGAPVGFQYGAEVSYPSPESITQGLILLTGQISGIIFILIVNSAGIAAFMTASVVLSLGALAISLILRESPLTKKVS